MVRAYGGAGKRRRGRFRLTRIGWSGVRGPRDV